MAVAITIGLWIWDELSYNKSFKNYDTIAQVYSTGSLNGQWKTSASKPRPLEFELRNKYGSSFKHVVMSQHLTDRLLSSDDKKIIESGRFMQPEALDMLSLDMVKGNCSALNDQSSIVISSSTAKALFGDSDPINQLVRIDHRMDVKVTGVYRDIPSNTEFSNVKFIAPWDLLMANEKWMANLKDNWNNSSFYIYVQINPNTTLDAVSDRIKNSIQNNVDEESQRFNVKVFLHPMSKWHLFSEWKNGANVGGQIEFVWLFGIIGVFVLLLACINFMNLSTARSEKRAKEVGVRKAIGSNRQQLIKQFLSESFLVVIISFVLAILLVILALPWFNKLAGKQMSMFWANPFFWLISSLFVVLTSLIAGSYPAFYLSSFNPVKVLKGRFQLTPFAALPRRVLVVLQFTVSVTLIIGTIIVYRQIQHAKNRPLGYDKNGLVAISIKSPELLNKADVLTQELKKSGLATNTALSSSPLTHIWQKSNGFEWNGKTSSQFEGFGIISVSHDFGKTAGWQFKQGRDFSREYARDSVSSTSKEGIIYNIIINEAAAKYMDMKQPVGEILKWEGQPLRIIGVIKDQVMDSPYDPSRQTVYMVDYKEAVSWLYIRLNPQWSVADALMKIEKTFKTVVPSVPFEYKFADVEYERKFAAEKRIGKLATVFASLAILISCLGLWGLTSFIAEQRSKEISIRKVLGATVLNIWQLLSIEFILLVGLSCVLAFPISWHFLHKWLEGYQYHTEISWWVFAVAALSALAISLLTVSYQAIKTALANPVKSLKTE